VIYARGYCEVLTSRAKDTILTFLGTTTLQVGDDYHGEIAASVEVDLQPVTSINHPEDEEWFRDLSFLIGVQ
jgi:hypothetical protein